MAPHSNTLPWKIPWMEGPGGLQSMGSLRESDTTGWLHFHFSLSCIGEGNGNLLQYSCLDNPRDGGAWWAAVYGVAQRCTRLKRFSSRSSSLPYHPTLISVHDYWKHHSFEAPLSMNSVSKITEVCSQSLHQGNSWPEIKSRSPALQADSLPSEPPGKPRTI